MLSSLIPTGVTSLLMDLTSGYAPLAVGLVGLTWISAGMITWMAIAHYWEASPVSIPAEIHSSRLRDRPAVISRHFQQLGHQTYLASPTFLMLSSFQARHFLAR